MPISWNGRNRNSFDDSGVGRGRVTLVVWVVFILLIGLSAWLLYKASTASSPDFSALASGVATLSLVIITAVYVYFTGSLVEETKKSREQAVEPSFALDFGMQADLAQVDEFKLFNIGNGPAYDIDARLIVCSSTNEDGSEQREVPLVKAPNRRVHHYLQVEYGDDLGLGDVDLDSDDKVKLMVEYRDQLKNQDIFEITYDSTSITGETETAANYLQQ